MSAQGSSEGKPLRARRAVRYGRRVFLVLFLLYALYAAVIIWRTPGYNAEQKSKATVALIQSQHLTLADVDGKHLPPPPDPKLVDATIAGVDANQNGIRDDVELAIFKNYPNSPKIRAAELQYAMALQTELTKVFDTETLAAVVRQEGRGYLCISSDPRTQEVESLVANTKPRRDYRENIRAKYMASFAIDSTGECDLNSSVLQN